MSLRQTKFFFKKRGFELMKAWQKQGVGLENLKLVEVEKPTPGPKQIIIKVKAVSLNFRDKSIMDGDYLPDLMSKPFTPVSDAVGVVVGIGSEVLLNGNEQRLKRTLLYLTKPPVS